jgi:hypothetical protein
MGAGIAERLAAEGTHVVSPASTISRTVMLASELVLAGAMRDPRDAVTSG